jgi:hypothetical protein
VIRGALQSTLLGVLIVLAGCGPDVRLRVSLIEPATTETLAFHVVDAEDSTRLLTTVIAFTVKKCARRYRRYDLRWELRTPPARQVSSLSLRYGIAPPGFLTTVGPMDLSPGCYLALAEGPFLSGGIGFFVDSLDRVTLFPPEAPDPGRKAMAFLGAAFLFLIGAVLALWGAWGIRRGRHSRSWPTTQGVKTKVDEYVEHGRYGGYMLRLQYRYEVAGKKYRGSATRKESTPPFVPGSWPHTVAQYQFGRLDDLMVHYNPLKPSQAVLIPGVHGESILYAVVGTALVAVAVILARATLRGSFPP